MLKVLLPLSFILTSLWAGQDNTTITGPNSQLDNVTIESGLKIEGMITYEINEITRNETLGKKTLNIVDSSKQDILIQLPDAKKHTGRIYIIKKINRENKAIVYSPHSKIDNGFTIEMSENTNGASSSLQIISTGNIWALINYHNIKFR